MKAAARRALPAIALGAGLLAAWEIYVDAEGIEPQLLPAPHAVAEALWNGGSVLWRNFAVTAEEVALGLALALLTGFLLGVLLHVYPLLRRAVYPLAVGSQAVPIPVIGVLLVFWWGFGILPKLVVIALICFFPVLVTTVDALAAVDPDQLKLLRTLDASRWQALRLAELPSRRPGGALRRPDRACSGRDRRFHRGDSHTHNRCLPGSRAPDHERHQLPNPTGLCGHDDPVRVRRRVFLRAFARRAQARALASPTGRPSRSDTLNAPSSSRLQLLAAALAALCAVLALSACGSKQDTLTAGSAKQFKVMLDFFPNADHAALYAGIAHGDFRAVGLEVVPEAPADPSEPLKLLAAGRVDLAISYEPELLLARDKGLKVVSIGALVQRPLTSIIALPGKHVSTVGALAGKRVGTAGIAYQTAELHTALEHSGLRPASVHEANVGFNLVPAMLSGQVDATIGGFWNYEGIQLRLMHKRPVVIPVDRAGVPTYDELVLVAREGEARTDGQDLRAFLQALTRGEREVRANPAAAASTLDRANPSLEAKLQLESIKQTLPAAVPAEAGKPFGWQSPAAWAAFGSWMFDHHLLSRDPGIGLPPFTNEFLPGQGI